MERFQVIKAQRGMLDIGYLVVDTASAVGKQLWEAYVRAVYRPGLLGKLGVGPDSIKIPKEPYVSLIPMEASAAASQMVEHLNTLAGEIASLRQ